MSYGVEIKEYSVNLCKVYESGKSEYCALPQFKNIFITLVISFLFFSPFSPYSQWIWYFLINPCHFFISLLVFHSFSSYPRDFNRCPWLIKVWDKLVLLPLAGKCRNLRPLNTPLTPSWRICYCHPVPSGIFILDIFQTPQEDIIVVSYRQYLFRLTRYFLSSSVFISSCVSKCLSGTYFLLPPNYPLLNPLMEVS